MLFLRIIPYISFLAAYKTTSEYIEETSECVKNLTSVQYKFPALYVGCKTFKILIDKNDIFVDKTLLLKEVFKKHTFLTIFYLPHKFSKTINLEMIRTFVEIQLDSTHSVLPRNDTFAYNFFAFGKILRETKNGTEEVRLFEPPLISRHIDLIDQHVAQYPVIYFNLSDLLGIKYRSSWKFFKDRIGHEFRRYSFVTSGISSDECSRFTQLLDYFNRSEWDRQFKLDTMINLPGSVIFLAEMTTKFFQKKPILFVDEYDSILNLFLHNHYINDEETDLAMKFFGNFVTTVFSREDVWHRIILTGTFSLHKNFMNSLPGSKAIYHAFDNNLSHFFGFTEKDVQAQSKHFGIPENELKQMQEYYNGYQMGQHNSIYNPWPVMKFFESKELTNHWEEGIRYPWFMSQMWDIGEIREQWLDLLSDRAEFSPRPFEEFSENDLMTLRDTLSFTMNRNQSFPKIRLGSKNFTQILMYHVDVGYLTWSNYTIYDHETIFNLRIANYEIKRATYDKLRLTYQGYLDVNIKLADNATATLHAYLFSRQREQLLQILTRSFERLFNRTDESLEGNFTNHSVVNPICKHIIDYIGLRLRYHHGYKLDRKIDNGFVVCKQNVSSMVVFNNNLSVDNADVLNRINNYTHPWTEFGFQTTTTSITYVVIGMRNKTEICTRRYGDEPPIEITTAAPVKTTEAQHLKSASRKTQQTKRPPKSPKTRKMKSRSAFNRNVTKALDNLFKNQTKVVTKHIRNIQLENNFTNLGSQHSSRTAPSFHGSSSVTELNPKVTASMTESSTNKATVTITATKGIEIRTFDHKIEQTKDGSEARLNITTVTSTPIKGIQEDTVSAGSIQQTTSNISTHQLERNNQNNTFYIPVEQSPFTVATATESKADSNFIPELTKSSNKSLAKEIPPEIHP